MDKVLDLFIGELLIYGEKGYPFSLYHPNYCHFMCGCEVCQLWVVDGKLYETLFLQKLPFESSTIFLENISTVIINAISEPWQTCGCSKCIQLHFEKSFTYQTHSSKNFTFYDLTEIKQLLKTEEHSPVVVKCDKCLQKFFTTKICNHHSQEIKKYENFILDNNVMTCSCLLTNNLTLVINLQTTSTDGMYIDEVKDHNRSNPDI